MADVALPTSVVVLGSTGSIGVNALEVIEHLTRTGQRPMQIVGLAAGQNATLLLDQAKHHQPDAIALCDTSEKTRLASQLPDTNLFTGEAAAAQMVANSDAQIAISAIVGIAGLPATLEALKQNMTVALANKETLVAAGPLVADQRDCFLPVDSEHSAIYQCLAGQPKERVRKVILTASGGPFRDADPKDIANATVDQALRHPTWAMGPKITIDSATMMNKALEIIEAHYLFDLPAEKIQVLIHRESIVHSFVEFVDQSVLAQLGEADMRTPIQYALTCPDRPSGCGEPLDFTQLSQLSFELPNAARFPALQLGYDVLALGGTAGAIMNAANEVAVDAFLNRRIAFGKIVAIVQEALNQIPVTTIHTLDDVLAADAQARQQTLETIDRQKTSVSTPFSEIN